MNTLTHTKILLRSAVCLCALLVLGTTVVDAQTYQGGGLSDGLQQAQDVVDSNADIGTTIVSITLQILGFMGIAATAVIIIAGLYLILGLGSDSSRSTAKNIVLYTVVGLLLISLSGAIVMFFAEPAGIAGLIGDTGNIGGSDDIGVLIVDIILGILTLVGIAATAVIIIAGLYLILGLGSDSSRSTAKNIVLYTVIGLLLIGLSGAIVAFFAGPAGIEGLIGDTTGFGGLDSIDQGIITIMEAILGLAGLAAVVVLIIAGLYLILGLGSDSSRETARKIVLYTITGIILIGLSAAIVQLFAGAAGVDVGDTGTLGSGQDIEATIISIVEEILSFAALAAVVVIIIAGLYLILGLGGDSSRETARKIVTYAILGLILIALSRGIVQIFLDATGANLGSTGNISGTNDDIRGGIVNILQAVLSYLSLIAIAVIIIAGLYLILGLGEESAKEKAKKIIIYTIAGLILIVLAGAIVDLVIGVL